MPYKPTDTELRELAGWLEREVVGHPFYERFLRVVNGKIDDLTDAIVYSREENAWDRGRIVGMKELRDKPFNLIRNHASSQDTETPAGGAGRKNV